MYLHCSDRGLDGWWLDQGYDCQFKSPWLGVLCLFQQQQQQQKKKKKKKKSHIEMIECGVWSSFTVCKNCLAIFLGITKSHSRMYLKWTGRNLTSFANSLSLPLSLSLWKALSFYPHINMTRLLSSYKLFALTLLEKLYRTSGNRTRFDPHLTWNTCICYGLSLFPLL